LWSEASHSGWSSTGVRCLDAGRARSGWRLSAAEYFTNKFKQLWTFYHFTFCSILWLAPSISYHFYQD
jgi:hypothetical protein